MRALFECVTAARMSLTACVMVAAMLSACGGGNTDTAAADTASTQGTGATTPNTPNTPAPTTPGTGTPTPPPPPPTGSIALSWSAPATNSDGSPVTDLAGYRVYYGTASGFYTDNVTITNPSTLSATITNLPADTYYVIVRAFNSVNAESQASVEVSKTIQ
jgi:hypothetical protein